MEPAEMSLDDIIKKNKMWQQKSKVAKRIGKPGGGNKKVIKKGGIVKKNFPPPKTVDARYKLIKSNRSKIVDAREVIAEHTRVGIRDARELLSMKKQTLPKKRSPRVPRTRSNAVPALTITNDMIIDDEDDLEIRDLKTFNTKPITSLRRTVKNDGYRSSSPPRNMPRLPTFSIQNHRDLSPDPFDCYVVPERRAVPPPPPVPRLNRSNILQSSKMSAHMDAYMKSPPTQKGILRSASRGDEHDDRFERSYLGGGSSSSSRYSNESAGIFAKIMEYKSPPRTKGYRILITNLVSSVSESDVEELFSEIGDLISAKLIKEGTAEVVFRNAGDDERAHDVYHNRLIDGQPMKIALTGTTVVKSKIPPPPFYRP